MIKSIYTTVLILTIVTASFFLGRAQAHNQNVFEICPPENLNCYGPSDYIRLKEIASLRQFNPNTLPKINSKVIIMWVQWGLGNQMFYYAACYNFAKIMNASIWIADYSRVDVIKNRTFGPDERIIALDYFNISYGRVLSKYEFQYYTKNAEYIKDRNFYKWNMTAQLHYAQDYFESDYFFLNVSEEIKQNKFQLSNRFKDPLYLELEDQILQTESVALHIRRGDLEQKYRGLPWNYYLEAIDQLKQRLNRDLKIFVFTDYVGTFFQHPELAALNATLVSDDQYMDHTIKEFTLMSKCKHFIIANSTFSWWAAYLAKNKDKIVMAPFPKFSRKYYDMQGIKYSPQKQMIIDQYTYPADWIKIDPFKEEQQ
ncbi:glycosyl transferase family 11 [Stylonychia lemnae]|uniref:Glycosyl transferase family 11 n=1 Tax=Stylonychia lemnae TaxID=5949 RepID=A0A078B8Q2_STYLE|nr:glycosyl transferase family 11 [Stylonychia lemnae]|eukprot:CDW90794.1 glycosyl transferase family 11 [Stylonychia lemnae]